ncbi:metallophosphoesterase [Fibrella sp. WM1]|uniref:metallophosphoesterase family protein n=1 Tax=Fibrella musci TaxID=3242485 RepID=UPI00352270D4
MLAFLADTQAPMWIEALFLKKRNNVKATQAIFRELLRRRPETLYWLGDVVVLGYKNNAWPMVDTFLAHCDEVGIDVKAILGNHDVMGRPKKGQRNFQRRFADHVPTGYAHVTDGVGVILLNSNFSTLTLEQQKEQQTFYETTLAAYDADPTIQSVIVTCHHAPFSNSRLVGSSKPVQLRFVPPYLASQKAKLFITGHAHAFERFETGGKVFLVIGGGGGLHQPLYTDRHEDRAPDYKPMFHYLTVEPEGDLLHVCSHRLSDDQTNFVDGYGFVV